MNAEMGRRIRICRDTANYNQEYVANKIGMTRSTYSRHEKAGDFDIPTIIKLAEIFRVNSDYIIYGKPNRAEQPKPPIEINVDDYILTNNDKEDLKILKSLNVKQRKMAREFLKSLQNGMFSDFD